MNLRELNKFLQENNVVTKDSWNKGTLIKFYKHAYRRNGMIILRGDNAKRIGKNVNRS